MISRGFLLGAVAFCVVVSTVVLATAIVEPFGTVVVPEDEQRDGPLRVAGGTVIVAGQVNGDLVAYGGRVRVADTATVTGDVRSFGGTVRIAGRVQGDTTAYGGRVAIRGETGPVNAGGVRVLIGGDTGSVTALGGQLVLLPTADVQGDLEYDARLTDRGGSVAGTRESTNSLLGPVGPVIRGFDRLLRICPLLAGLLAIGVTRHAGGDVLSEAILASPIRASFVGLVATLAASATLIIVPLTLVGLPLIGLGLPIAGSLVLTELALGQRVAGIGITRVTPISRDTGTVGVAVITSLLSIPVPSVAASIAGFLALLGGGGTVHAIVGDDRVFSSRTVR